MPRHINLRQIEAFKAVIENGTVSRAAEMLNITQPTMSKLITNLEADAAVKLFDRVKGRLAPTEHAMRFYEEIGRIFAGVRQVENALDAIRREEQGRLAVGVMAALAGPFIERVTSEFFRSRSNVFFSVHSLNSQWIVDWVVNGRLDVGLVSARIDNPHVRLEPIAEHALVCIMPREHSLAAKSTIEPSDLDEIPFVAFHPDTYVGHLIDQMLDAENVKPKTVLTANITPTLCGYVAAGLGVALVHPLMLGEVESRLVIRRFKPDIVFHFQLCRSSDSRNVHLVNNFIRELRATIGQLSTEMSSKL